MSSESKILETITRHLIFIQGKGGVGKTAVSQAIALRLAQRRARTLWVALEDPTRPAGELKQMGPYLWHLNCDFSLAFEEYAALKIGAAKLTRLFLQNKVIKYLAKAAPGIHELVLLGKVWYERLHYSHVVIDMPSTGYGLAMFQSTINFVRLFQGGPLNRDAHAMLDTFRDPLQTGHLIVSLPEEMPLRESLELSTYLKQFFPHNLPAFLINRVFPSVSGETQEITSSPDLWATPMATSMEDFALKRHFLEDYNLRLWRNEGIGFKKLRFIPPPRVEAPAVIVQNLAQELQREIGL